MPPDRPDPKTVAVPASRLSRLAHLGGLASRIAGTVAAGGAAQLARGQHPRLADLLLTPANARRVADQLAQMRGAAMKMGQLLSMDGGEMLPPELTQILARLRADADPMPGAQVKQVLTAAWGADWLHRFQRFDVRPLAAASIGQVHRAITRDGRDLAIKVQYPGVRRSIDSDVDNVAALLRLSGLVPRGLDLGPMLAEAKRQLHDEADYAREGRNLARFGTLLADRPAFVVPALHADLTTQGVLAMSFVEGGPVEDLTNAPQAERNRVMAQLIDLMFRELFEFHLMQTDPNFANYRYASATGRVILLDFGATRVLPADLVARYRDLLRAGLSGDRGRMRDAAIRMGFLGGDAPARMEHGMLAMFDMAMGPLRQGGVFDFGASDLAVRLRDAGLALAEDRAHVVIPPMDTLFVQRKFGGIFLLANRLKAQVDLRALIAPHL
ncbi:MAG: AarF/ABC1/UbiB kinase family protein [Gemmobacter sp.]|nr:AarF/ABC1/UbiB kinase family protein [Gemmobacter sp.]